MPSSPTTESFPPAASFSQSPERSPEQSPERSPERSPEHAAGQPPSAAGQKHREADPGPLLPPSLLAKLERLELVSRKVFRGQIKGERRSRRRGQSVEFADFRNYVAGDDLRMIDWNLYARLDQLFLKMFTEEEDLHFYALVDASASMRFGSPSKFHVASQLAASLGYVGLCRGDRVAASVLGPHGRRVPVLRGRSQFAKMTDYFADLDPTDPAHNVHLIDGVKQFAARNRGNGVVVLITDLLDKRGYQSSLRLLLGRRMDIVVLHVIAPEEMDPPMTGDFRLIDAEDGEAAEMTLTPHVNQKYRLRFSQFCRDAKSFCAQRGMIYIPVRTDVPVETVVSHYLRGRGVIR